MELLPELHRRIDAKADRLTTELMAERNRALDEACSNIAGSAYFSEHCKGVRDCARGALMAGDKERLRHALRVGITEKALAGLGHGT